VGLITVLAGGSLGVVSALGFWWLLVRSGDGCSRVVQFGPLKNSDLVSVLFSGSPSSLLSCMRSPSRSSRSWSTTPDTARPAI